MKTLQITRGQVKQIALLISERYAVANRGMYYVVTDIKTKANSLEPKSLVSYNMQCAITREVLRYSGKTYAELDHQNVGVEVARNNEDYTFEVKNEVIKLLSGFDTNSLAEGLYAVVEDGIRIHTKALTKVKAVELHKRLVERAPYVSWEVKPMHEVGDLLEVENTAHSHIIPNKRIGIIRGY